MSYVRRIGAQPALRLERLVAQLFAFFPVNLVTVLLNHPVWNGTLVLYFMNCGIRWLD